MASSDSICMELRTLSHLIKRDFDNVMVKINDKYRLTAVQGWVIKYLCDHQNTDVFQRDLENSFSVRRSTMTSVLQLMEKNGLITREPVSYDARLKKLLLTKQAVDIHNHIESSHTELEKRMCEGITQKEQEEFLRIIHKLQKNITKEGTL